MDDRTRVQHRNTELGDRACFCAKCGWARRYYPGVIEPPKLCPDCSGRVVSACDACGADVLSIMATDCDVCGESLRPTLANGLRIRRPRRLPMAGDDAPQSRG